MARGCFEVSRLCWELGVGICWGGERGSRSLGSSSGLYSNPIFYFNDFLFTFPSLFLASMFLIWHTLVLDTLSVTFAY